MSEEMKPIRVTINADNPMQFSDIDIQAISPINEAQQKIVTQLSKTFTAYREAVKELVTAHAIEG